MPGRYRGSVDTTPGPDPAGPPDGAGRAGRGADDAGPGADGTDRRPDDQDPDDDLPGGDPLRFNNWMKRSATGAVLSGIALGLQQALERKRELPAFVMEAPDEPGDPDAPITLHFDPDDPTKTIAVIRHPAPGPTGPAAAPGDGPADGSAPTR
jgi:hypothetical protein